MGVTDLQVLQALKKDNWNCFTVEFIRDYCCML